MAQDYDVFLSPERQALRARSHLRPVTPEEEGSPLRRLPDGVYGFSSSAASDEMPLFARPIHGSFEIHKLAGGEVAYVGYVSQQELPKFETGAGPCSLSLYPDPCGEATHLVSIPASRVERRKAQAHDNGMPMQMEITPAGGHLAPPPERR